MPRLEERIGELAQRVEEQVGRLLADDPPPPQGPFRDLLTYIDQIQRKPPPVQMSVGGAVGFVTGYLATKGLKKVAIALGVSLITFQFCNHRGYIKLNRTAWERDLRQLRQQVERQLSPESAGRVLPTERQVSNFVRENAYLLGGFVAGSLLGYGIA